jgi:hypothetical protein
MRGPIAQLRLDIKPIAMPAAQKNKPETYSLDSEGTQSEHRRRTEV